MSDTSSRSQDISDDAATRLTTSGDDLNRDIIEPPEGPENDATVIAESPKPSTTTHATEIDDAPIRIAPGVVLKQRFHLLEIIGSGGMGTVYKAIDKRDIEAGNSNFIAVKIINEEYKNDTDLLKALHSEARKTQTLAHPNIMTVYDFDRDKDSVFLTMEYIDGAPLNQLIRAKNHGLELDQALTIIRQLCEGLAYAHSKDIIHLDFKPSNVLIDQHQRVKIFDFGIARMANYALTRSFDAGVLGGLTPGYASLEMINGETPDPRDDIYALACVSYELLTGHHPYDRQPANIALQKHLSAEKPKGLSNPQWQTLKQGLAIHRKERVKTVELFKQGMLAPAAKNSHGAGSKLIAALLASTIGAGIYIYGIENPFNKKTDDEIAQPKDPVAVTEPSDILEKTATTQIIDPSKGELASDEISAPTPPDIALQTDKPVYQIGDQLQVSFSVKKPMFMTLLHLSSAGETSVLFPNPFQTENYCLPGVTYQIPPANADFNVDIHPPKGQDIIVAIGSDQPLSEQQLQIDSNGEPLEETLKAIQSHTKTSYRIE